MHNFLLRHCYVDAMRQGFSPNAALYFTFLVSIVVHELLLWGAFGLTVRRRRRRRRRRLWVTVQYGACAYTLLTFVSEVCVYVCGPLPLQLSATTPSLPPLPQPLNPSTHTHAHTYTYTQHPHPHPCSCPTSPFSACCSCPWQSSCSSASSRAAAS